MAKKKSDKEIKSEKKANKGLNKELKGKGGAKRTEKIEKPLKSRKKALARKKTTKRKAKQILSKETWKQSRDSKGNLKKGRKKSIKLTTQADRNRYQTIVKAISDYYKKAGIDEAWMLMFFYIIIILILIQISR